MKRALVTLVLVAGLAAVRTARASDGRIHVVLVDGSEVQGELVEKVPGDHLTISLATGEVRTIPWTSIQSMNDVTPAGVGATASPAPLPPLPGAVVLGSPWLLAGKEVTWPRPDRSRSQFEEEHVYIGVTSGIGTPSGYGGVAVAWDPVPWVELELGAGVGGRFGYGVGGMARVQLPLGKFMRMGLGVGLSQNFLSSSARAASGEWPGAPSTARWLNLEFVQQDFALGKAGFLRLSTGFAFLLNRGAYGALCPDGSKDALSESYDRECVEKKTLPATPKSFAGEVRMPFVPYFGLAFFWRLS